MIIANKTSKKEAHEASLCIYIETDRVRSAARQSKPIDQKINQTKNNLLITMILNYSQVRH